MITINITLLLELNTEIRTPAKVKKKSKKGKERSKKQKKQKGRKKNHFAKEKKPDIERLAYEYSVGGPVAFAHVEYQIFPDKPSYQIDVNCWGPIAKIYSEDSEKCIRVKYRENKAWVPIKVKHYFSNLSDEELMKVCSYVIKFTIWSTKDKLKAKAKSETIKTFYVYEKDVNTDEFVQAFAQDPNIENPDAINIYSSDYEIKQILEKCENKKGNKPSMISHLNYFPDIVHDFEINKIIGYSLEGKEVKHLTYNEIVTPSSKKGKVKTKKQKKSKKPKKSKKGSKLKKSKKTKKGDNLPRVIMLPAKIFFTDPNLAIYRLEESNVHILDAYLLVTVTNLLTKTQKVELNPLVIKIRKIMNLPKQILEKNGFSRIRVRYDIPQIGQYTTAEKSINKSVRFYESHVHFMRDAPKQKILDFLKSKMLYMQIEGIRDLPSKPITEPSLFGTEANDINISKRMNAHECKIQLGKTPLAAVTTLAIAAYDVSSLLKTPWMYEARHTLHNPDIGLLSGNREPVTLQLVDKVTVADIHIKNTRLPKSGSPLTEDLLVSHGTCLKVALHLQTPQGALLHLQTLPLVYQRILLVIKNTESAMTLLNEILLYNQDVFIPEVVVTNYLRKNLTDDVKSKSMSVEPSQYSCYPCKNPNASEVISGFMIDNVSNFLFFIEGSSRGFISTIWRQFLDISESVALKKLNLLFQCQTIQSMHQYDLFPSVRQLISLNIEWGTPLRWKPEFQKVAPPTSSLHLVDKDNKIGSKSPKGAGDTCDGLPRALNALFKK